MHESESEREVAQSCPTPSNPMDCSLPGSSIHGIFQARVLEWVPLPSPLLYTTAYKWSKGDCKVYFICFPFLRNHCPLLLDIQCLENHCFIYLPTFFGGGVGCISKYGPCYSILAKSGSFCHLFKIFNCCDFFSHSQYIFTFLLYFLNWHFVFFFLKRAPILRFLR